MPMKARDNCLSVPSAELVFQPPGKLQQYSYRRTIYVRIPLYGLMGANYAENNNNFSSNYHAFIINENCDGFMEVSLRICKIIMYFLRSSIKSKVL